MTLGGATTASGYDIGNSTTASSSSSSEQQQQSTSIVYVTVPLEVREEMERQSLVQEKQRRSTARNGNVLGMMSDNNNNNSSGLRNRATCGSASAAAAAPSTESPTRYGGLQQGKTTPGSHSVSSTTLGESSTGAMSDGAMTFLRTVKRVQSLNRAEKLRTLKRQASLLEVAAAAAKTAAAAKPLHAHHHQRSRSNSRFEYHSGSDLEEHTPLLAQQDQDQAEKGGCGTADDGTSLEDLTKIQEESHTGEETTSSSNNNNDDDTSRSIDIAKEVSIPWALYNIIFGKGIVSMCLAAAPFAALSYYQDWSASWIFWLNFIVLIPLAAILGHFTEELALHTNQTIGGLINATFGNAVEVVVGIQALLANEIRVVQASMLGSIFSNLLLVLGCCMFFGGIKHREQTFNSTAASANMGLLALSGIALVLPTPFADYYELHDEHVLIVSRTAAIFLMFMYIQLLVFQLKTHVHVFEDGDSELDAAELAVIPFSVAMIGLCVITLLVSLFSDFLVSSIEGFTADSGISRTFVGIILLPIVGNAVEHVAAVTVAMKNKMDLAMGIAVGSCAQISLFVTPLMVLTGWALDKDMTLNFPHFEVILFVMSVFTVSVSLANPKCNWLQGSLLITTYLLICVGFWFEKVKNF